MSMRSRSGLGRAATEWAIFLTIGLEGRNARGVGDGETGQVGVEAKAEERETVGGFVLAAGFGGLKDDVALAERGQFFGVAYPGDDKDFGCGDTLVAKKGEIVQERRLRAQVKGVAEEVQLTFEIAIDEKSPVTGDKGISALEEDGVLAGLIGEGALAPAADGEEATNDAGRDEACILAPES